MDTFQGGFDAGGASRKGWESRNFDSLDEEDEWRKFETLVRGREGYEKLGCSDLKAGGRYERKKEQVIWLG